MIIVLDTNVLVSGLLTPFGSSGEIVRMISSGKLTLEYDARILIEYQEVLNRPKFQFDKDLIDLLIDYIKKNGKTVTTEPLAKPLPDPDDAPFLEVALEGKSEILVTGNKVPYPVQYRKGIKVLYPIDFIKLYQKIKDHKEQSL
jgi:putative PIN family toxin of toxin-antitoxin system